MREIASGVPGLSFIVVPSMAKVINNYNRGGVSQSEPPGIFFKLIVFFNAGPVRRTLINECLTPENRSLSCAKESFEPGRLSA